MLVMGETPSWVLCDDCYEYVLLSGRCCSVMSRAQTSRAVNSASQRIFIGTLVLCVRSGSRLWERLVQPHCSLLFWCHTRALYARLQLDMLQVCSDWMILMHEKWRLTVIIKVCSYQANWFKTDDHVKNITLYIIICDLDYKTSHRGLFYYYCISWKLNKSSFHWCMVCYDRTIFGRDTTIWKSERAKI